MKARVVHKLSLCAVAALLYGCSTTQPPSKRTWRVEPLMKVAHAGSSAQDYHDLGRYHDGMLAWPKSVEAYRKALAIDPGHVEARNALAVALARQGRYGEAEAELRQALVAAPQRADLHSNLGYLLLLAQRPGEALPLLQAAVQLDPQDGVAQTNLRLAQEHGPQPAAQLAQADPGPSASPAAATQPQAAAVLAAAAPKPPAQGGVPPAPALAGPQAAPATDPVPPPVSAAPSVSAASTAFSVPSVSSGSPVGAEAAAGAFNLEVTNGFGRTGAARQLGQRLQQQGVEVRHLSNLPPYGQPYTVVLYRPGQAAAARRVAAMLPLSVPLVMERAQRTEVRVLLGHDWPQAVAVAAAAPARE